MALMEVLSLPVVAVVVAHEPGGWFDETLRSLAAQQYGDLSILVLATRSSEDRGAISQRVAGVLPTAYLRLVDGNPGFGALANEARSMVKGAAYLLLCHDDVALAPDAVAQMVEEAYRSNSGIVSPKVVAWDNDECLVHVGMTADRTGSVSERVQPFEIDHGQHDAVRDVFVAPGGCTLIRADLFDELEGFDPAMPAMGEDLDLCWRAQLLGARVIVAPAARVRHREELAGGRRSLADLDGVGAVAPAGGRSDGPAEGSAAGEGHEGEPESSGVVAPVAGHVPSLQEMQRRNELLVVLKSSSTWTLLWLLPWTALLALAEIVVAALTGHKNRAVAVRAAWRWNLAHRAEIREARQWSASHRRVGDQKIHQLQTGGSARASAFGRRLALGGLTGSRNSDLSPGAEETTEAFDEEIPSVDTTGRVSLRVQVLVWLVAALVVYVGSRGLLGSGLPWVGQFSPFTAWGATWHQFFAGWQPSGVGSSAPVQAAWGVIGLAGTVLFGAMGLTQKVLIFGCLPVGAWGAFRLLQPFRSPRASLVAGLSYLALAVPYDALSLGRWGALLVYAGSPWALLALARSTGVEPFARRNAGAEKSRLERWRPVVTLALVEAVLLAFVPAFVVVVVVMAVALVLSSCFFGDWNATRRALAMALKATGLALVVNLPWVLGALSAGKGVLAAFGVPTAPSQALAWTSLLRFVAGPIGGSVLTWGFVVAAVAPLLLARDTRFQWSARLWSVAVVFWTLAWVMQRHWTGEFFIEPLVLLAPAGAATVGSIGLGVAAFEQDLQRVQFGWRQMLCVVAVAAAGLGALPTVVSALPGRWAMPYNDFRQSVAWMPRQPAATTGGFRVLWLGDPRALNQGSWNLQPGLAYATTEGGPPDLTWTWAATSPGPARSLAEDVSLALSGQTADLGALVAPYGVRYVAVLTALAPEISGEQAPVEFPVPATLQPELARQLDLHPVVTGAGITVYANNDWRAIRSVVPVSGAGRRLERRPLPRPALAGPIAATSASGQLPRGVFVAADAPAGSWHLTGPSGSLTGRSEDGWATGYDVAAGGRYELGFSPGVLPFLSWLFSVLAWGVLVVLCLARRRWSNSRQMAERLRDRIGTMATEHRHHEDDDEAELWELSGR